MIDVEEILSKMNPNQKINYDRVMQKMVQDWEKDQKRPTILMHTYFVPLARPIPWNILANMRM